MCLFLKKETYFGVINMILEIYVMQNFAIYEIIYTAFI